MMPIKTSACGRSSGEFMSLALSMFGEPASIEASTQHARVMRLQSVTMGICSGVWVNLGPRMCRPRSESSKAGLNFGTLRGAFTSPSGALL